MITTVQGQGETKMGLKVHDRGQELSLVPCG
jgi:hypothetical protein